MARNIRGNRDGENGENLTYTIHGRGVVERELLVEEVENGKHPNHSVYEINGTKFVRANPNSSEEDNINRN